MVSWRMMIPTSFIYNFIGARFFPRRARGPTTFVIQLIESSIVESRPEESRLHNREKANKALLPCCLFVCTVRVRHPLLF